jgi:hypothetical protein
MRDRGAAITPAAALRGAILTVPLARPARPSWRMEFAPPWGKPLPRCRSVGAVRRHMRDTSGTGILCAPGEPRFHWQNRKPEEVEAESPVVPHAAADDAPDPHLPPRSRRSRAEGSVGSHGGGGDQAKIVSCRTRRRAASRICT